MMRHILIDHARSKSSSKRRHHKVEISTRVDGPQRIDLSVLEAALIRLRALDEKLMELVEMRYFGGMTTADIAEVMEVSEPTVKRRWMVARAWLADAIANPLNSPSHNKRNSSYPRKLAVMICRTRNQKNAS